jgi:hypothetical protein
MKPTVIITMPTRAYLSISFNRELLNRVSSSSLLLTDNRATEVYHQHRLRDEEMAQLLLINEEEVNEQIRGDDKNGYAYSGHLQNTAAARKKMANGSHTTTQLVFKKPSVRKVDVLLRGLTTFGFFHLNQKRP